MKVSFTLLFLFIASQIYSQKQNQIVQIQVDNSIFKTNYTNVSISYGLENKDKITFGLLAQRYNDEGVKDRFFYGARIFGQTQLYKRSLIYISADLLKGKYYILGNPFDDYITRNKTTLTVNLGFGYPLNKNKDIELFVGYSPTLYNPKNNLNPYEHHAITLKIAGTLCIKKNK